MSYYEEIKNELLNLKYDLKEASKNFDKQQSLIQQELLKIQLAHEAIEKMAKERQIGFPWLANAYEEYFKLQDNNLVNFLKYKHQPAIKASEIVKEYAKIRRKAIKDKKIYQYLVEYYESICPFLLDFKEEVTDITSEDQQLMAEYTKEELEDYVTHYLSKEEFRKLGTVEKNQLALDRYWKRPKSKWHIGKMYERYVGYLFEEQSYDVDYVGIFKGLEDLGRDIIAKKNNKLIVVQCKNWSKFRTIYEKHIFQFFGTVFEYKDNNKDKNVKAIFYTTTKLSDLARRFAEKLNIELKENFRMDKKYPCIKCNISKKDGAKIYHLPFDQQYDKVKIEKHLKEFYCLTVKEAEEKGFRRAFRYKGYLNN